MKRIFALALASAASVVMLAQPVLSQTIVVTPEVSHQEFVERVSRDLDRQLLAASRYRNAPSGEAISIVRFTRDNDGRASNVKLYRASRKHGFDRIAMRAVSRLRSLDNLPDGVGPDQLYQANIIFADTAWEAYDLRQQLAAEEAARIASSPSEKKVFAFGNTTTGSTS